MARKGGGGWVPSFLKHRALLGAEAALVVGVLMELSQRQVTASHLPGWGKTLFVMAVNVGLLGALVLFTTSLVSGTLKRVFDAAGLPVAVLHGMAFVAAFFLYAWVWDFSLSAASR
jgi:hypothetical protein